MSNYAELEQVLKAVHDCGQYGAIHSNAIGGSAVFTNFGWLRSMADFEQWPFRPAGERDWAEDFSHENGNYHNHCTVCGHFFLGHKRRVVCKACSVDRLACKCSLRIKLVGDGCAVCNPKLAEQLSGQSGMDAA